MSKILIVEDEPAMQIGLKDNLEFDGYAVDIAGTGKEGLEKILNNRFDLVLLDVMLPEMSGFDVCKNVRKEGIEIPIILLTARGEEIDKVLGLELGADDYVTKPFSVRELLARIKALLRRTGNSDNNETQRVDIGRLSVDFATFQAEEEGKEVKMSHKEFEVLKYLFENRNELVSRYDLLENVWGYQDSITTRTVDNFILRIRQKVEENPANPHIILTVHGAGYRFVWNS
jgi:DNA-binding response OmpR family regulator